MIWSLLLITSRTGWDFSFVNFWGGKHLDTKPFPFLQTIHHPWWVSRCPPDEVECISHTLEHIRITIVTLHCNGCGCAVLAVYHWGFLRRCAAVFLFLLAPAVLLSYTAGRGGVPSAFWPWLWRCAYHIGPMLCLVAGEQNTIDTVRGQLWLVWRRVVA